MPEFPTVQGGVIRGAGAVSGSSSLATLLTASSTANVKGSVVELTAATEFDANWILVQFTQVSVINPYLVDVMIGAAPEQPLLPDLFAVSRLIGGSFGSYLFPCFIPKGSRLSARCQCAATLSPTIRINVILIANTMLAGGSGPSVVSAYGAVASSLGTNVDPGGTANTDSAWVQLTPATDRAHNWLCISGRFGDGGVTAETAWRMDIGIGAAAEEVLIPDLHYSADTTSDLSFGPVVCLPCFVPAGSRLTARARCNVTTDGDRDISLKLYGAG